MEWVLVKTILSLCAIIGLMFGLVLLLKKFMGGNSGKTSNRVAIDVLGSRTLEPKRSMYVVRVLDRILVVGSGENGLQTLTEIEGDEYSFDVEASTSAKPEPKVVFGYSNPSSPGRVGSFTEHLSQQLGKLVSRS